MQKTILKKINKAIQYIMDYKFDKALDELLLLKTKLEEELEKGDTNFNRKLQHLMGWYLKLWNDKPPEALRFITYKDIIGKHFKELILLYERNNETIDQLKQDYEEFRNRAISKKRNAGLLDFRISLPKIKLLQNVQNKDKWCLGNVRGKEYYQKAIKEE